MGAVFLKWLDRFFGKWSSRLVRIQESSFLPERVQRFAVIRLWAIGESILALPAIAAIKKQSPDTKVTVITTPRVADVFREQAFIDEILVIQPTLHLRGVKWVIQNWKSFDVAIDFEPYFYTSAILARLLGKQAAGFDTLQRGKLYTKAVPYTDNQHVVKTNFDLVRAVGVGARVPDTLIPIQTPPSLRARLRRARHPNLIALAPGGRLDFRRWPAERFAEAADYLAKKYTCEIVLVGNEDDVPVLKEVEKAMKHPARIVSRLSLPDMAALLSACRLTIANDGGLMHVSAAMGTPTLGLFGPETPVRFGPYGPNNRALYHQLDGNPVIQVQRAITGRTAAGNHLERFVEAITVEEVKRTADAMLQTELQPQK